MTIGIYPNMDFFSSLFLLLNRKIKEEIIDEIYKAQSFNFVLIWLISLNSLSKIQYISHHMVDATKLKAGHFFSFSSGPSTQSQKHFWRVPFKLYCPMRKHGTSNHQSNLIADLRVVLPVTMTSTHFFLFN